MTDGSHQRRVMCSESDAMGIGRVPTTVCLPRAAESRGVWGGRWYQSGTKGSVTDSTLILVCSAKEASNL